MIRSTTSRRSFEDPTGIFARRESGVRSYSRRFPVVFERAEGALIYDDRGRPYLDFLSGAGSLNYGHNHPVLAKALVDYISRGGVAHSLDLHTRAKAELLEAFQSRILSPRTLDYVVQFTGPTGANAVEAALKLARKATGRHNVVSFTNGFHGVTLGSLAATGNQHHRGGAGLPLASVTRMPYDGYLGPGIDTLDYLEKALDDPSSGIDHPAAIILETVQGEGGLNAASPIWLKRLAGICQSRGIVLIADDIQAGCGRTGTFFSFEEAGIVPDIVTLSKSLSGFGLPLAVVLIRRKLDLWKPGEHNGTFRGNNHAFITAAAAMRHFWSGSDFESEIRRKGDRARAVLADFAAKHESWGLAVKGRGMMLGLSFEACEQANAVSREAFRRGLIVETSGPRDEVVKCLCPLTIGDAELERGLEILCDSIEAVLCGPALAAVGSVSRAAR